MNERIKELAEEAGLEFEYEPGIEPEPVYYGYEKDLEKFAKVIVRECLSKIELEAEQYHNPVWAVELVNDIKDYFGVE